MIPSWEDIERHAGFAGMQRVVREQVIPRFEAAPLETMDKKGAPKGVERAMSFGFALFIIVFMSTFVWLPSTALGEVFRFILFPVFFIASFAFVLWLNRKSIVEYLLRGEARLIARSDASAAIADHLGLTYVMAPGGLPAGFAILAKLSWLPKELKGIADRLEERRGMDAPVEIARASGVMLQNVVVLGTEKQKKAFQEQSAAGLMLQDGFHGVRNGVAFDMFEWVESRDEQVDLHHLTIVLKAPFRLHGITQVRARKTSWPPPGREVDLQAVDLGPRSFNDMYRLRSSDQIESRALFNPAVMERLIALAHGDKFLGVASGEHLVFDIAGSNRFDFLNVATGVWSDETIRAGLGDLMEALDLVDALAHAFMVARNAQG